MLTRLFLAVWRMSVSGGVTALVVFLAVLALRRLRAPRAVCCVLWLAVLVRLLCPVGFSSAISIYSVPAIGRCVEALQGDAAAPEDGAELSGRDDLLPDLDLFATDAAGLAQPAAPDTSLAMAPDALGAPDTPAPGLQAALPLLAVFWLAGTLGMALHGLAGAVRLRRRVALAFRVDGEPGAYTGEGVAEPFAFGILRPRIYLPPGLAPQEQRIILLHERAHLRRRDNLVKPLFYAALCLHWFSPPAWLAFRGMACDMEAACDEAVLRAAGSGVKEAYCQSLLRFSGPRPRAAVALSFGEGQVSGRVRSILTYKRPAFWAGAAAALAAALLAAACMADPAADRAAEPADALDAAGAAGPPAVSANEPANGTPAPGGPDEGEPAEGQPANTSPEDAEYPASDFEEGAASDDPGFIWPVPEYEHVTRWMDNSHKGTDILAEAGTPIVAAAGGEVISALEHFSYGNYLVIDHGEGWRTLYAHCENLLVEEGDTVEQGQQIAAVGSTGNTNSTVCHFEIYLGSQRISAREFFPDVRATDIANNSADASTGSAVMQNGKPVYEGEAPADPGFLWPVPDYKYVSLWMAADGESIHDGTDIAADAGTPILAALGGEVIFAGYGTEENGYAGYGFVIVLKHEGGWQSCYAHCESLLAETGDTVEQGRQIAAVGNTGFSTGAHCHFELGYNGGLVSAQNYFAGM